MTLAARASLPTPQPAAGGTVLPTTAPGTVRPGTFDGRAVGDAVTSLVGEFGTLPLRTLVPWRIWLNERIWQQTWSALFLVAAAAPFLLLHLGGNPDNFHKVSWGFSLYFAFIWFIALHTLIQPGPLPWQLLSKVALFTTIAGVAIAIGLEKHLVTGDMNVVKFVIGVGFPEEFAKALAVYLFVYRSTYQYSLRSVLFVGAVSGLAFGAAEAVSYSSAYAQALPYLDSAPSAIVVEVWRLVTDSLFHACMAGVTAFFIGLASHYRSHKIGLMGFGLAFAAVLHGLYDNFAQGWLGTALAVLIVLVFVGYVQTGDQIGEAFGVHAATPASPAGTTPAAAAAGWASPPPPAAPPPEAAPASSPWG